MSFFDPLIERKRKCIVPSLPFKNKNLPVTSARQQKLITLRKLQLYHGQMLIPRQLARRHRRLLWAFLILAVLYDLPNDNVRIHFLFGLAGACGAIAFVRCGDAENLEGVAVELLGLWP